MADDNANLPLAILFLGIAAVAGFMAMRPWPQASGQPIKPGAYVVDVLKAEPPPAGPQVFSQTEVDATELGIATIAGIWAASKVASAASGLSGFLGGILSALGLTGAKGAPPPIEEVP